MKTMAHVRVMLAAGTAVMLAFGLGGCVAVSHVSAGLHHGDVRFVYCEAYSPTELEVWQAAATEPSKSKIVWRANGNPALKPGSILSYGVLPFGFVAAKGPVSFDPSKSSLEVDFIDPKTEKTLPYMTGDFDGRKLVEGKWLNWNGNIVDKPCDG